MFIYAYIYICMFMHVCVVYIHMYIYIYMYMYLCIYCPSTEAAYGAKGIPVMRLGSLAAARRVDEQLERLALGGVAALLEERLIILQLLHMYSL